MRARPYLSYGQQQPPPPPPPSAPPRSDHSLKFVQFAFCKNNFITDATSLGSKTSPRVLHAELTRHKDPLDVLR